MTLAAAPALAQEGGDATLAIVEPADGATYTTADESVDVDVAMDVRGVPNATGAGTPTGTIHLFLFTQAVYAQLVTNATDGEAVEAPVAPREGTPINAEGGTVPASALLDAGRFAVLNNTFVSIQDVPEGEYVLLATLQKPRGEAPGNVTDVVTFTVVPPEAVGEDDGLTPTLFPDGFDLGGEDAPQVEPEDGAAEEEDVAGDGGEEAPDEVLGDEEVGQPVVGPEEQVEGPVTPFGNPLLALFLGVVAFAAIGAAALLAARWRR